MCVLLIIRSYRKGKASNLKSGLWQDRDASGLLDFCNLLEKDLLLVFIHLVVAVGLHLAPDGTTLGHYELLPQILDKGLAKKGHSLSLIAVIEHQ